MAFQNRNQPRGSGGTTELPNLRTFEEVERKLAHLSPPDRLRAFLALPEWEQREPWLELRLRLDYFSSDDVEELAS